jgi:predicted transcriptional regulator
VSDLDYQPDGATPLDMSQMITRLDSDLHERLRAKARAEHRSVNDFVTGLIEAAVAQPETRQEWKNRMLAEGKLIVFEPEGEAPGHEELERLSQGWGTAVSEALEWARGER